MLALRLISLLFVSLALLVLGADVFGWVETDTFDPHTVLSVLGSVSPAAATGAQNWAASLPNPVNSVIGGLLQAWAFAVLGIPGVLLAMIGTRE